MKHSLMSLPFSKNALEPAISAETIDYHYGKHHRDYVDKLNHLIRGTEFENLELEDIISRSSGPIFNNAGQVWNHNFYWQSLSPQEQHPSGELMAAIQRDFGSFDSFRNEFQKEATNLFGSGWAWLVQTEPTKKLSIVTTSNADNPWVAGYRPLIVCDVWEHAYYIDYRNERAKYLSATSRLLNWDFANSNFTSKQNIAA